ncbi:hypothetical protein ASG49_12200 [Marmoricola sp. Leaf446]|uniref:hypothetical protein n=1 Tax=Marmoricola sp. Leaf446 TaxID=1736379 RepID=UPI0006F3C016|nr:hypothetical protein [Marmoricola sp. Leaf446]KQT91093.1 hypothetical protein ASG49_12200 [Marmoricola sp. Leaf446]
MSQPPPPPYAGPPHGPPGPPGPAGRPGPSNKAKFWIGFALAGPLMFVLAFLTSIPSAVLSEISSLDPAFGGVAQLAIVVLELVGLVAALVVERTRWWAIGFVAGAATVLIVLAGACVVILVALVGASG